MQIRTQVLLVALATVLASARSEARGVSPNQLSGPAAISRSLHGHTAAGVMFAQVGNTVPEPSAIALLGLSGAVAGVAFLRRRNK